MFIYFSFIDVFVFLFVFSSFVVVVICVNECVCVGGRRGCCFEYNQRHSSVMLGIHTLCS